MSAEVLSDDHQYHLQSWEHGTWHTISLGRDNRDRAEVRSFAKELRASGVTEPMRILKIRTVRTAEEVTDL